VRAIEILYTTIVFPQTPSFTIIHTAVLTVLVRQCYLGAPLFVLATKASFFVKKEKRTDPYSD
jgi:hypothetical protein